jgi:hypothetical protein
MVRCPRFLIERRASQNFCLGMIILLTIYQGC